MDLALIIGFVFLLSLLFLVMIFGERLSLFGVVDNHWMLAPFELVTRFWDMVCEATDRIWCFVFDHFWWVTATVTGSIGILLIALLMVSGLSNEARAVRLDRQKTLDVGGLLDIVPEIDPKRVLQTIASTTTPDDSNIIVQERSADRFFVPPRRSIVQDIPEYRDRINDVPRINWEPDPATPNYSRDLELRLTPFTSVGEIGRPVRSRHLDELIQRNMRSLRDDWRMFDERERGTRTGTSGPRLREDSEYAVDDLYSQVSVIPGDYVSSNSLHVEKAAPANPGAGEFDIQIRITNRGLDRVSGIIVREQLPPEWTPVRMSPRGVFRNSSVMWLLDPLRPQQTTELILQVVSDSSGSFQSQTEVSALTAVSTPVKVLPEARAIPPVEPVEYPKLRLKFDPRPTPATTHEWVDVTFEIENIGNVVATGVVLYVNLPLDLDHEALNPTDLDRQVDSRVARLNPGESQRRKLTVRPNRAGRHVATASLHLKAQRLAAKDFEIDARESIGSPSTPIPEPDFINQ